MRRFGWQMMGVGLVILFVGCLLVRSPWAFVLTLGGAVFGGGVTCYKVGSTLRR